MVMDQANMAPPTVGPRARKNPENVMPNPFTLPTLLASLLAELFRNSEMQDRHVRMQMLRIPIINRITGHRMSRLCWVGVELRCRVLYGSDGWSLGVRSVLGMGVVLGCLICMGVELGCRVCMGVELGCRVLYGGGGWS